MKTNDIEIGNNLNAHDNMNDLNDGGKQQHYPSAMRIHANPRIVKNQDKADVIDNSIGDSESDKQRHYPSATNNHAVSSLNANNDERRPNGIKEQPVVPSATHVTSTGNDHEHKDVSPASQPANMESGSNVDKGNDNGKVMGYEQQIAQLQDAAAKYTSETEEQRKKRERREKSKKIIAAVTDGVRALSNLYFTSQYAPNMYNHDKGSQIAATTAHLDKLKAEREAEADRYLNYSLKIGNLENERAKTLRELEAQAQAQRLAREKAQREQEKHNWEAALQPDKVREQTGKADKAEQDAVAAQAAAEAAPELQRAKIATEEARAGSLNASAANSRASAAAHGRSNVAEFSAWDENGKEHKFRTKAAADAFAKQHGTWEETDDTTETETDSEMNGTTKQTQTKKGGHPGMTVGEDNTPPSRRNNNDNRPPSRR